MIRTTNYIIIGFVFLGCVGVFNVAYEWWTYDAVQQKIIEMLITFDFKHVEETCGVIDGIKQYTELEIRWKFVEAVQKDQFLEEGILLLDITSEEFNESSNNKLINKWTKKINEC